MFACPCMVCAGEWEVHPEVAEMMELQRVGMKRVPQAAVLEEDEEEEEEEEEESSDEEDECELSRPTALANRFAKLDSLELHGNH